MGNHSLDQYVEGTSVVHRLDPRLKLLATLAFVVVTTTLHPRAWVAFLALVVVALGAVLVAQVPLIEALKRSMVVLPFAGVAAISLPFTRDGHTLWAWENWGVRLLLTDQGMFSLLTVMAKSWLSVLVSGLLVATTAFPTLLAALRSLGVPAALTAIASFTYRYLFVLVDEAMRLRTAREARSAGGGGTLLWRVRVLGGMVGSLFIRSYERSERIYAAMLSRGYAGQIRVLSRLRWQARDSWAALVWGSLILSIAILGRVVQ